MLDENKKDSEFEHQESKIKSNSESEIESPGLFSMIGSVLAAMIGIQTEEQRKQDFTKGKVTHFIVIGIIMVIIFIVTLINIVDSILKE